MTMSGDLPEKGSCKYGQAGNCKDCPGEWCAPKPGTRKRQGTPVRKFHLKALENCLCDYCSAANWASIRANIDRDLAYLTTTQEGDDQCTRIE